MTLVSLHNSLAKFLPPSIIRCITSFFTDLDTPLPHFLDSLPDILHLLKVAREVGRKELKKGDKERMAVVPVKEASFDDHRRQILPQAARQEEVCTPSADTNGCQVP